MIGVRRPMVDPLHRRPRVAPDTADKSTSPVPAPEAMPATPRARYTTEEIRAWSPERLRHETERLRHERIAAMSPEQQQAEFLRLLVDDPWPKYVCEYMGLPRGRPWTWAKTNPEIRAAIDWCTTIRHPWAIEDIDAIVAGRETVYQYRWEAIKWRASRGPRGEWLGDRAEGGTSVQVLNVISAIPRPELPQTQQIEAPHADG